MTEEELKYWQGNPVTWITTFLRARLWWKQEEIAEAVRDEDKVTVRSAHGVGKSFIAAAIILWFLFTHPFSKVVSTAPTDAQVRTILWEEIRKFHQVLKESIDPAGHLTQKSLHLAPGWVAWGRSTDKGENLLGAHEKNLLVVFDEAGGIARDIFEAAEGLITARGNKRLLIGNPIDPTSYFAETHKGDIPGFHKIRISAFDSPNLRKNENGIWVENLNEEGELPFPELTSLGWINEMRKTYGEKSAFWSWKVLGEFPTIATDALIDGRHLSAAVQKGLLLRNTISKLEEGKQILDVQTIRRLMGKDSYE